MPTRSALTSKLGLAKDRQTPREQVTVAPKQGSLLDLLSPASTNPSGRSLLTELIETEKKTLAAEALATREAEKVRQAKFVEDQTERLNFIKSELAATAELMRECKRELHAPIDDQLDMMNERLLRLQSVNTETRENSPGVVEQAADNPIEEIQVAKTAEPAGQVGDGEDFRPLDVEPTPAPQTSTSVSSRGGSLLNAFNLILFCGLAGALLSALFALSAPDDLTAIASGAHAQLNTAHVDRMTTSSVGGGTSSTLAALLFESMTWRKFVMLGVGTGLLLGIIVTALLALVSFLLSVMGFNGPTHETLPHGSAASVYSEWSDNGKGR